MKVGVHYPNVVAAPDSVFWVESGKLQSFSTLERLDPGYLRARMKLAGVAVDKVEGALELLGERNAYPDVWDVVETEDPRAWLRYQREAEDG